ncbi:hypothetical protein, partial [Mycobacterium avium]|uniref:hypothetical protein n=1 Tax=Mycobacterium avium TaxID=1764 RepID=UPI003AFB7C86
LWLAAQTPTAHRAGRPVGNWRAKASTPAIAGRPAGDAGHAWRRGPRSRHRRSQPARRPGSRRGGTVLH